MIKNIKLHNCTPYQQAELSDCKKINFVFGANGSGKSTISSLLAGVRDPRFTDCGIEWTGTSHERIEVYNKEFRHANLQQDMPGIFTLGSATIEEINELEKLKAELQLKTSDWEGLCEAYRKKEEIDKPAIEEQFRDAAWNQILKANENELQQAFGGLRNSKDKFIRELKRRIVIASKPEDSEKGKICKKSDLFSRAQALYASKPERKDLFQLDLSCQMAQMDEILNDEIWSTVISGSRDVDIAALIEELGSSTWVNQGRNYLRQGSSICPFCQKETIDDDFRKKLEAFFDGEYKQRTDRMHRLLLVYRNCANQILERIDKVLQGKDDSVQIGQLNVDALLTKKELLGKIFEENEKIIEGKIAEPGIRISIPDITDNIAEIVEMVNRANMRITEHNALVKRREEETTILKNDVWATCIHDADALIKAYDKDIKGIDKALSGLQTRRDNKSKEVKALAEKIEEKGKNVTSVMPTIKEINKSLSAYGFTNFTIQPAEGKPNYYCIKRDDGSNATNTLSEGEETFLSFLYFMQRAKGATEQGRVSDKKIIVLDDPISSLDSTILYVVGAIVKQLIRDIRNNKGDVTQLFVLTHNVFFHKEASFTDGKTKRYNDVNYWMIRKNNGVAMISSYGMDNPISTSYELLWRELKDNSNANLISIQNIMRRIIENYFGMLGGKRDDFLVQKFESAEEQTIARSLLYWINDGSHSIPDDLFIDTYTDAVPKYKEVFRGIFEKSGHLPHYNMMMGITNEESITADESES